MKYLVLGSLAMLTPVQSYFDDPPDPRIIDHDKVVAFPTQASPEELKWQPYLATDGHSCVPYPVVDGNGHVSGGLESSGKVTGDCVDSAGQVYVRSRDVALEKADNVTAHMYAWYLASSPAS